ncbi:MAG: hypothetical protein ABIM99_03175 [Candidatus Dojkabacteria bacterium]
MFDIPQEANYENLREIFPDDNVYKLFIDRSDSDTRVKKALDIMSQNKIAYKRMKAFFSDAGVAILSKMQVKRSPDALIDGFLNFFGTSSIMDDAINAKSQDKPITELPQQRSPYIDIGPEQRLNNLNYMLSNGKWREEPVKYIKELLESSSKGATETEGNTLNVQVGGLTIVGHTLRTTLTNLFTVADGIKQLLKEGDTSELLNEYSDAINNNFIEAVKQTTLSNDKKIPLTGEDSLEQWLLKIKDQQPDFFKFPGLDITKLNFRSN